VVGIELTLLILLQLAHLLNTFTGFIHIYNNQLLAVTNFKFSVLFICPQKQSFNASSNNKFKKKVWRALMG
jgi:hypothetical protein